MQLSKPVCHGYELIILQLAQGILDGPTFLHEMGVSHRDLKPSNILVSNPKDDFGVIASEVFWFWRDMGKYCSGDSVYEDTYCKYI